MKPGDRARLTYAARMRLSLADAEARAFQEKHGAQEGRVKTVLSDGRVLVTFGDDAERLFKLRDLIPVDGES